VSGASKLHDAGDPTTSLDTMGASEYTSTPAKGPSVAAARPASFTSSTVTSRLEAVGAKGFRRLRSAHPDAIVQCPVDFLGPLVMAAPRRARAVRRMLAG